jgi:hypothetical protein
MISSLRKGLFKNLWFFCLWLFISGPRGAAQTGSGLRVASDFQSGSVRILRIDSGTQTIEFMPGGDPVRGWPCWWYFRVDGLDVSKTVTLRLRGSDATVAGSKGPLSKPLAAAWAMPTQAAVSRDGETWTQTEKGVRDGEWMVYVIHPSDASVWVAWGPPYTVERADKAVQQLSQSRPGAEARELCRSRENRPVPLLRICEGDTPTSRRFGVWVQARQHAWECGSSWVAQGFADWVVGDSEAARWVRTHAEIFWVPVMDVDNVATGNGGKDAVPHDHNRDWAESPHWNETFAARKMVDELVAQKRMDVFLDLHNPAPGDPTFFYLLDKEMLSPTASALRDRFVELGYGHISKGVPFVPMSNRPKYTGPAYHPLWRHISANWVAMHGNPQTVALCLETIWNSPSGTTEGYRAVGSRLAAALREFLGEMPSRE